MSQEQETTLAALKTSIQMEIDGKEFYMKHSKTSTNEIGKKLLKQLAGEEDVHRKTFERIFQKISANKGWPDSKINYDGGRSLRKLFTEAIGALAQDVSSIPTEIDAIETAMQMENMTFDFYTKRSSLAAYSGEKEFYEEIAAQEKEHHRVLLDYFEFLKNPGYWYIQKEHISVDGG
jgi:rubrerythrin